ncbi:MAG: hypothetical protein WAQ33_14455 [Gaiellaceae bacterium]
MTFEHIVDLVRALAWPVVAVVAFVALRHVLPEVIREAGRRATKVSVLQFAIELAPPTTPGELRPAAVALLGSPMVGPSLLPALTEELKRTSPVDYMIVHLFTNDEGWLTSRLFLWADLLRRTRGLECFVFVRGDRGSHRFIGLAETEPVRNALAAQFPWFEQELAKAYSEVVASSVATPIAVGRLDPQVAEVVAFKFIEGIRRPVSESVPDDEWTTLPDAHEHTSWITPSSVRLLLEDVLDDHAVRTPPRPEQDVRAAPVLRSTGRFVAVVDGRRRFVGVVDREAALEQLAEDAVPR